MLNGMRQIVTRPLREDKVGIEGYLAGPERREPGPGLVLIHQHSGLTGYLKTAAYKFAQLGYTTVIPNLYHMLGYPAETHIDKGTEIQNKILLKKSRSKNQAKIFRSQKLCNARSGRG
jgi:dienelactone hydrolase